MKHVVKIHEGDPNFPHETMQSIKDFLGKYALTTGSLPSPLPSPRGVDMKKDS